MQAQINSSDSLVQFALDDTLGLQERLEDLGQKVFQPEVKVIVDDTELIELQNRLNVGGTIGLTTIAQRTQDDLTSAQARALVR